MRVLCIGGEDHKLRIAFLLALKQKGIDVSAAGSCDAGPFVKAGIDFRRVDFPRFVNPLQDFAAINALSRVIEDLRPQIVQCFDTKLNILVPLAARRFPGVKVVSTINGLGWLYSSNSPVALALRPIYTTLQTIASRWTTAMVFQNREDQAFFLKRRMVTGRQLVIPGSGIDVDKFEGALHSASSTDELRRELGLADREVVLTVTRLTKQKGVHTLLEAAKIVHEMRPSVRFLLVGPHEREAGLAIRQADIDRHAAYVIATGPRSDVPALLKLADVFAFPTELREGVPRVLLEAAIAGRPIVTTRMPGCTDVVRDEAGGFLVPPKDPLKFAEAILRSLKEYESARVMATRTSKYVKQEFNLEITVQRYVDVYNELIRESVSSVEALGVDDRVVNSFVTQKAE